MRKIFLQALVLVAVFVGALYLLVQVDWIHLLRIDKVGSKVEKKLGDLIWESQELEELSKQDSGYIRTAAIINKVCDANGIAAKSIRLHIVENGEVNAFALPDHHMVVHTGLLKEVKTDAELAGVLAHEVAHMELSHVMKKIIKQVGFSLLFTLITGDIGGSTVGQVVEMLSSSAYDRSLEKDADLKAVDYLKRSGYGVDGFADFLDRLGAQDGGMGNLSWLSTHPDSKERARYVRGRK